jgi:hypothetical protein
MVLMLSAMLPGCGGNYQDHDTQQNKNTGHASNASSKQQLPAIAFGKVVWESHLGAVDDEPVLPSNIDKILDSDCPFWPGKKVKDTHLLVLIPATVDDKPFTLDLLGELVKQPQKGNGVNYELDEEGETVQKYLTETVPPPKESYWVLMTKNVVSRNNSIDRYPEYDTPTVLEAVTTILTNYVRSKEWIYEEVYTYCKETMIDNKANTNKDKTRNIFVGSYPKKAQLKIGHKIRTVLRFQGTTDIPPGPTGRALLRKL